MPITFPSNTKSIIDEIRGAIGRDVTFNKAVETICPSGHGVDPITGDSIDPFCTICSGVGTIITYSGTTVPAHITHDPSSTHWTPGGTLPMGDCRIQIEFTDSNLTVVEEAEHVLVDDLKYKIHKVTRRGVPEINRLLIDLVERNT
jgi:hypothetical protein